MSLLHAVVWTDHQSAQVLRFDAEHVLADNIRAHTHHTAQHGSAVRLQHEFFGEVCDALPLEVFDAQRMDAHGTHVYYTEDYRFATRVQP